MKRLVGGALFAACFFYVACAAYSIDQIVRAIQIGDSATLAEYVDFPSVRESLKGQINAALTPSPVEPAAGNSTELGDGLVAALRSAMTGTLIDVLATPSGLAAVMAKRRAEGRALRNPSFSLSALLKKLSFSGPTIVRLDEGDGEQLILGFRNWKWKIIDIKASPEKLRHARRLLKE